MSANALNAAIVGIAIILFCWFALLWVLKLPEVHYSNASGDCVRVLYASVDYDCDNIPRRHRAVTVR